MLIKFRVENYKSFDKEQSLSMVSGSTRDHADHVYDMKDQGILRTAVIFGSNGSGKTNLVKAMIASRGLIFGYPIPKNDYCRINPENSKRATAFEYTVELNGTQYAYGFEVLLSSGEILTEWLYNLSNKGRHSKIFFRIKDTIETELDLQDEDSKYFEVYSTEARSVGWIPFIAIMSKAPEREGSKLSVINRLMRWFTNSLRIVAAGTSLNYNINSNLSDFTGNTLPHYGTGISGIRYEDVKDRSNMIPPDLLEQMMRDIRNRSEPIGTIRSPSGIFTLTVGKSGEPILKKMMFDHNGTSFEYTEESDGTKRLVELLPLLNGNDLKDLTYVVDEIDRSLHPQMTQKFIRDFESLPKDLRRQLIVTTHESRLMDLDIVRRDEIWFVEKDTAGTSKIYSLEAFGERKDRRIDKAYLDGRYGAIPCFRSTFPDLEL